MATSWTSLSQCYICYQEFSLPQLDDKKFPIISSCCSKVFDQNCLDTWRTKHIELSQQFPHPSSSSLFGRVFRPIFHPFEKNVVPCPNCRDDIYLSKAQGNLKTYWEKFQLALKKDPSNVRAIFNQLRQTPSLLDSLDAECSVCGDDYPSLGLIYTPKTHSFVHTRCCPAPQPDSKFEISASHLIWEQKELDRLRKISQTIGKYYGQCAECHDALFDPENKTHASLLNSIKIATCSHIFHNTCLKNHIKQEIQPCPAPHCTNTIPRTQSVKILKTIWQIFITVLQQDPDFVNSTLKNCPSEHHACTSDCREPLPSIGIAFDAETKELLHTKCNDRSTAKELPIKDVVRVIFSYAKKTPELARILTLPPRSSSR